MNRGAAADLFDKPIAVLPKQIDPFGNVWKLQNFGNGVLFAVVD